MNEYWIVKDRRTGRIICNCADINDAIMMVSFDSQNRLYSRHRYLMDQVIDVSSTTEKQLPTTDIVVNMDGGVGGSWEIRELPQINLPEGQGQPIVV